MNKENSMEKYMTDDFYNETRTQIHSYKADDKLMSELSQQIDKSLSDEIAKNAEDLDILEEFGPVL